MLDSESEDEDKEVRDSRNPRVSCSSKVNFTKLSPKEKEQRCVNMSKKIKQLRRRNRFLKKQNLTLRNGGDTAEATTSTKMASFQNHSDLDPGALSLVKDLLQIKENSVAAAIVAVLSRVVGQNNSGGATTQFPIKAEGGQLQVDIPLTELENQLLQEVKAPLIQILETLLYNNGMEYQGVTQTPTHPKSAFTPVATPKTSLPS